MPRRRGARPSQKRALPTTFRFRARIATWEHSLDKWLRRLSHISQAGLLLFAAGLTYFVIMPMYADAALDEAIARKANDMKRVSVLANFSYVRRRSIILHDFVRVATVGCATSALAPPLPNVEASQATLLLDKTVPAPPDTVAVCLQKIVSTWADIGELRSGDRTQLINEIKVIGLALEEERHMARLKFDTVPQIALVSPDALPRPSVLNQQSIDFKTTFSTPDQVVKQVLSSRIEAERQRIKAAYAAKITQDLAALEKLVWLSDRVEEQ